MVRIKVKRYGGYPVRYRTGTTDEKIVRGILDNCPDYKKVSIGFDVEPGEHWLDLGANIGAFSVYIKLRGATSDCYEPERECFKLLDRNVPWFNKTNAAVTNLRDDEINFFVSNRSDNHYRGSIYSGSSRNPVDYTTVANLHASCLGKYDAIKLDIEGSEFGLLDDDLIPECNKLVMEYHSSIDPSPDNLKRRLEYLKDRFKNVNYPPEYDKKIKEGVSVKCFQDRNIFCWD